jgi:hypothetical protein
LGSNTLKVDDFKLVGHIDSDFYGDKENGVSTLGYLTSLVSTTIFRRSHKQSVSTYSTIEAEYVAVVEVTMETVLLRKILEDLQEKPVNATPLLIDNTFAIKLAKNPRFHDRTKHINAKYHLIQHHVEAKTISLILCFTSKQISNIFTKALGR